MRMTHLEQLRLPLEPSATDGMTAKERRRVTAALARLLMEAAGAPQDGEATDER